MELEFDEDVQLQEGSATGSINTWLHPLAE